MPARNARSRLVLALAAAPIALAACESAQQAAQDARQSRTYERVFEERASHRLVTDGDRALRRGNTDLAIQKYRAAIDQHSGAFDARLKLAELLLQQGDYDEAITQLRLVRTERPDDPRVLDPLAEALAQTGNAQAVETVLGDPARRTNDADKWLRYGRALFELGDVDKANTALKRAAMADGGRNVVYQLALAQFAEQIGDPARALRRYRMALHLDIENEAARAGMRRLGRVPGPSYTLVPEEAR